MEVKFNYKKFKKLRKEKKLTQEKLAELAGTSDRYIRAIEAGKKVNPSAVLLYRAGQAIGQPVEAFMEDLSDE